jgi:transcriptional regulator with XRE-family HTH domain
MERIGAKIREKRNEMGFSLEEVGAKSGLSFKTVLTIEHGKAISMLSLWAICRTLNLEISIKDKED